MRRKEDDMGDWKFYFGTGCPLDQVRQAVIQLNM